jgi:hypothetical protein
MPDEPKKTGLDRKLISLEEPHELRSWTESLKCSPEQLRTAVEAVGNSADAVRGTSKLAARSASASEVDARLQGASQ